MVDAGVTDVAAVRPLLELGAARVVIGTETLADPAALERLGGAADPARAQPRPPRGRLLSRDPGSLGSVPRRRWHDWPPRHE